MARVVLAALAGINVFSFGLFWYDKNQALNHRYRVPERTLQLTALLGGWVGGIMAMETFRHKTKKNEFKIPYYGCVAANVAVFSFLAGKYYKTGAIGTKLKPKRLPRNTRAYNK